MKQWYVLTYDIRDPKRLRRFHYRISKLALALQQSVFLIEGDENILRQVEQIVDDNAHQRKDDIRLYPIRHPRDIWGAGQQAEAFAMFGRKEKRRAGLKDRLLRLFRKTP